VKNVVEFRKNVVNCMSGAFPLIRLLCMVDLEEKPVTAFIYEEMD